MSSENYKAFQSFRKTISNDDLFNAPYETATKKALMLNHLVGNINGKVNLKAGTKSTGDQRPPVGQGSVIVVQGKFICLFFSTFLSI